MNKKALTLMEIIVSMTILTVVMAGLLNFFVSAKKHTAYSRSRVSAAELGRYFLDPLQMQVRQDQWGTPYPSYSAGSNCLWSSPTSGCPGSQTINNITFIPTYCIDGCNDPTTHTIPGTTLRRVKVVISWSEH